MLIVGSIVSVMAVLLVVNYSIPLFRPAPMQVSDRERPPMINVSLSDCFIVVSWIY